MFLKECQRDIKKAASGMKHLVGFPAAGWVSW